MINSMNVGGPSPSFDISPQDFLNTVAGYTQQTAPETSANKPVKLATVMALGANNTVQVRFDGESVTSTKYYPCLATYTAALSDRVALLPSGTTLLVIGAVGAPAADLDLTGGLTVGGDASVGGDLTLHGVAQGRGWVGSASRGSTNLTFAATETALLTTGNITWEAGRAYRVSIWGLFNAPAENFALLRLRKSTVSGTIYKDQMRVNTLHGAPSSNAAISLQPILVNNTASNITAPLVLTGMAGSVAQTWSFGTSTGNVAHLLVEDIGLASNYPGQPVS